jgi:hypothetical protein
MACNVLDVVFPYVCCDLSSLGSPVVCIFRVDVPSVILQSCQWNLSARNWANTHIFYRNYFRYVHVDDLEAIFDGPPHVVLGYNISLGAHS